MNILSPVGSIIITLEDPNWGKTVFVPVTIKPGYTWKVALFSFNVTLETENPADMGGYVGLESTEPLAA